MRAANNKGTDQTARVRGLFCTFVVRIWRKQLFSGRGSFNNEHIFHDFCLDKLKKIKFLFKRKGLTSRNVKFLKCLLENNNGQFKVDNKSTILHSF